MGSENETIELPFDWVVLDVQRYADHIPRDGIDEFFNGEMWCIHTAKHCRSTVGEFARVSESSRVRCRRKDLPPLSSPSGIEAIVCQDIAERQRLGITKYGRTVSENPLNHRAWLEHAYQECLDMAIYLRRAMEECK